MVRRALVDARLLGNELSRDLSRSQELNLQQCFSEPESANQLMAMSIQCTQESSMNPRASVTPPASMSPRPARLNRSGLQTTFDSTYLDFSSAFDSSIF
jgi:hypothetical protein